MSSEQLSAGHLPVFKIRHVHSRSQYRLLIFTLVELLVVIAIIAILTCLLLPSLNKAREQGKAVACAMNLKNVGQSFFLYRQDYGDYGPARRRSDPALYWQGFLIPYTAGKANAWRCPSAGSSLDCGSGTTYALNKWYYYSGGFIDNDYYPRMSLFDRFASSLAISTDGTNNYCIPSTYTDFRHNYGLNILFMDAHVKRYSYNEVMLPSHCNEHWDWRQF